MNISLAFPIWTWTSPALELVWRGRNVSSWWTCFSYSGQPWSLPAHGNSLIQFCNFGIQAASQKRNSLLPFFQVGRWKAQSTEPLCWGGRAPQCWCRIWAPVPILSHEKVPDVGAHSSSHLLLHTVITTTDCGVRSTVRLPTSVHKQWSHSYPPGCPEEIHTQELDIRVVHKWKSIDLASARDFLNNRFAETHAICKVHPEVIQTGPWLLNLSAHQGQLFSTFFSLGRPCILYQRRSGLMLCI